MLNHTSGLPENPDDIKANPNQLAQSFDYSESRMADLLKRTSLRTGPGESWAYSNIGMGLVGTMVSYLQFLANPPQNTLGAAINLTKKLTFMISKSNQQVNGSAYHDLEMGLAWGLIQNDKNERIFTHSGGTYGFSSFIAFNEQQKTGVILMANAAFTPDLSKSGLEILRVMDK